MARAHRAWRRDRTWASISGGQVIAPTGLGTVSFRASGRLRADDDLHGAPSMLLAFDSDVLCVADARPQDTARSRIIWRQQEQPMLAVRRYPAGTVLTEDASGMHLDLEGVEAEDLAQKLRDLGWEVLPPPPASGGMLGRVQGLAGWFASDPRWFGRTPEALRLGRRRLWATALGLVIVIIIGLLGVIPRWVVWGGLLVSVLAAIETAKASPWRDHACTALLLGLGAAALGAAPVAALVALPAAFAAVVGCRDARRARTRP